MLAALVVLLQLSGGDAPRQWIRPPNALDGIRLVPTSKTTNT
jgi:hypothetical protein